VAHSLFSVTQISGGIMSRHSTVLHQFCSRSATLLFALLAAAFAGASHAASEDTAINYTGAAVPATFTGALDADDSTYNRPVTCASLSGVGTATAYDTVTISNTSAGVANIVMRTAMVGGAACGDNNDTFMTLYSGAFVPGTPLAGCVAVNDDISGASNRCSSLSFTIPAGQTRVVAIAGFNNAAVAGGLFAYQVEFTGTTVTLPGPTKLAITAQPTPSVQALAPFNVTVQTQDAANVPTAVTAATTVTLAVQTGSGALVGTATCNIAIGADNCTVTGISSNAVQTGLVLRATSSPALTAADTTPFNVTAIPQTITGFAPATPVVFGTAPATLTATGGASGNAITFATTSLATICTVSGTTVTFTGVGTCNLTADQAGGGNYAAAPQATASIVITAASSTITGFNPPLIVTAGSAPITLTATGAPSGVPIVFATTSPPSVCVVSGNTVTPVGPGSCVLTANQAAGGGFGAAPQVTATMAIVAAAIPVPALDLGVLAALMALLVAGGVWLRRRA